MKKSEMVELIRSAISDGNMRMVDLQDSNAEDQAAHVLEQILKAGMIPPSMEFMMGDKLMRDNGWESENG